MIRFWRSLPWFPDCSFDLVSITSLPASVAFSYRDIYVYSPPSWRDSWSARKLTSSVTTVVHFREAVEESRSRRAMVAAMKPSCHDGRPLISIRYDSAQKRGNTPDKRNVSIACRRYLIYRRTKLEMYPVFAAGMCPRSPGARSMDGRVETN